MIGRKTGFFDRAYIRPRRRLKSQKENSGEEGRNVVKGTARRVIIVDSPDPLVFEEAIFVVRDDFLKKPNVSQKELMRQARAAAKNYVGGVGKKRVFGFLFRSPAPFIAAAGAAVTGLAYVILHMAGVY